MSIVYAVYVGIPILTAIVNLSLAYWLYTRHDDVRGSRWYIVHLGVGIFWMVCLLGQLVFVDETVRQVADSFETKAAVWSFLAWVVFAGRYSHTDFHKRLSVRVPLVVLFVVTLLPTFLPWFDISFLASIEFPTEPFPHVVVEPGPLYAVVTISIAAFSAYGLSHLVRYMLATPGRSALQLAILVLGTFSVHVVVALGNFEAFPLGEMAHGGYGVLPASVLTTLALFRLRLFEMQPVARNAVVEDLQDPVVVLDDNLTVVDYNRASTEVWPELGESVGQVVDVACPGLAEQITTVGETVETSGHLSLVVDGRQRHYSITVSLVGSQEARSSELYVLLLRDVTDLEQSRWQLERQNERLDQVAATISHDLRNPINVADGYAQILVDVFETEKPTADDAAEAREHLMPIRSAHDRMEDIIDDVLTLAREGQTVVEPESLSLAAVAREAWETVATHDGTLSVEGDRDLAAEESKLLTLLENLYRNAVEHGSEDVTVTVGPLEGGFYVADDGPGIPAADADEIFEYGYSTADGGTGLGLSIVRTIAESHGWTVELDTQADGTRFVFRDAGGETDQADASEPRTVADDGQVTA